MLAWIMLLASLPSYGASLPRIEWVSNWKWTPMPAEPGLGRGSVASQPSAAPVSRASVGTHAGGLRIASVKSRPGVAPAVSPVALISSTRPANIVTATRPLAQAANTSPLQVSVGFADSSSASANFPEPWNESNRQVNFVGGGTNYRAGGIRLDNPANSPVVVDKVTVDLGRPGPVFQLWTNITVPANGSTILTQTQDGNFNSSASPIVGCGQALASNETRIPRITVTIAGSSTDFVDTAHVLDTGGYDSSCRGNQSLAWRSIGTVGISNPAGALQLTADNAPHAVGTQDVVTVQLNDAANQPVANAPVTLNVVNGPNAGKKFTATTDATGNASLQYTSSTQGVDLLQASVNNLSGGAMTSQQASTSWTSADACASPATPNAVSARLIYIGQNTASFGNGLRLAALLTDGTGDPLNGTPLAFVFNGKTLNATTDTNGVAVVTASSLPIGQTQLAVSFSGNQSFQPANVSTTLTVQPTATLLRYTGPNLVTSLGQQTVSAVLTDFQGKTAVAGRTVSFTLNGVTATAVTDANGVGTATLNFPTAQAAGAAQLQISFAGDADFKASARRAAVEVFQATSFVIWGGNSGGLKVGQQVNFWGKQWADQVTEGQFGGNPSFKGFADVLSNQGAAQCQPHATISTLSNSCWQTKPGNSSPPATLGAAIQVLVSTAIVKSGSSIFGNIACSAVLRVNASPAYSPDPGHPGFGVITAVEGDCAGVFPPPAVLVASQQQASPVLPGQQVEVDYSIANQGATDATGVNLAENFDQVVPASGTANIGTIAATQSATGNFQVAIPAISARQSSEASADYETRLAASDGRVFTSEGEISFSDPFGQLYAPVDFSSSSQLSLPRLSVGLSGTSCIAPGTLIPYQVTTENLGSAAASKIAETVTFPDGATATQPVADLAAGTSLVGAVKWQSSPVAAKGANETTQAYLARLQSLDGTVLPPAVVRATWQDALNNAYGQVEQPFISLTERLPVVSLVTPATQILLPNQKTQFNLAVSNIGTGNAVQVTLALKRQDGSLFALPGFSLPGGQNATLIANYLVPPVAAKGSSETDAAYLARLSSLNGTALNLDAILNWTDSAKNNYGPTDYPFAVKEQLPVLAVTLSAPAKANSGDTITYALTVNNSGGAAGTVSNLSVTLPDGSVQHPVLNTNTVAPGAAVTSTVSFSIPSAQPTGIISATASVVWVDATGNVYGPVSARASTSVTQGNAIIVNAGPDVTVNVVNDLPLQGSANETNPSPASQLTSTWVQMSGPAPVVFSDSHSPTSRARIPQTGTYVLQLTAMDGPLKASSAVTITGVVGNQPPVVNGGPNQTIELPTNSTLLNGSATDDGLPTGSRLTFLWTQVSGPSPVTFANATSASTGATLTTAGQYILRLTASDSQLTGSADVHITVQAHNNPPAVSAGPNQTIFQLNTTLQGTATDDNLPLGSTLITTWSIVSGPGIVRFANPASLATSISFTALGNYVLRLTATDSEFVVSSDVTISVRPVNQPPVVNAGPDQTIILPSNTNSLPVVPTLISITQGFLNGVGIDYHEPTNDLVMSVNFPSGAGHNFELVGPQGTRTQFTNISGLTEEVYIATARDEGNGTSQGGFLAGEMFTGSGVPGVVVRISPDGSKVQNPWVTLPGESGLLRGQLYIDRTGVFGGDLIVATTTGDIWRVNSAGTTTLLANIGVPTVEGLLTIPNDSLRYGPWAGKILAGSETFPRLFAVDAAGNISSYDLGIAPEHIKLVNANENYFGVDFATQTLWGLPAPELSGMVGDILVAEEIPGNLWQVHWNGTQFETTRIAQVPQFEGGTMAPAGIAQVNSTAATVTLNGTVTDDGLPAGGTLTSVWTKISGPGTVTFLNPATPVTSATFSQPGLYVLRLTGSDSELSDSSDVTINIQANQAPVVDAGPDQQINFPATAVLKGTVTDDGLPTGKTLSTFWTKVVGPGQVTFPVPSYDPAADFSASSNPSGDWSYGWTPTRGGVFTADPFNQVTPIAAWFRGAGQTPPLVAFNNTGATFQSGTPIIPANTIFMHPGPAGENAVLRWTAPATGTFLVQGRFFAADQSGTTTDVSVLLNSSTTIVSGNINGPAITAGAGSGVPFTFVQSLTAGDHLDFSVGFGMNGFSNDSTALAVTITPASDPAGTAAFSLPGDYDLRLAAFDGELFRFKDLHVSALPTCTIAPSGLTGWWPGDGNTKDLAAENDGIIEGSGLTFAPGKIGQSFNLTGPTGDVAVSASPAYQSASFTLETWIYPTDLSTLHPILEFNGGGANGINGPYGVHLWINLTTAANPTPGAIYANMVDSFGSFHILNTNRGAVPLKQWSHVALTYDHSNGQAKIYVNGVLAATAAPAIFTPQNSFPFYIGARPGSPFHFLGQIDEASMYNRALSADEVKVLFTAGQAGKCKPTLTVSAGPDQSVSLDGLATLNGSVVNNDGSPLGTNVTTGWKALGGPGLVIFTDPHSLKTDASFSAAGKYVLQLSASDGGSTAAANLTVTVTPPVSGANQPPVVNAGPNQEIFFPQNSVTLHGTVSDDGLPAGILTQFWTVVSGPGTVTFADNSSPVTAATFSAGGAYVLRLLATDSQLSGSSDVTINVKFSGAIVGSIEVCYFCDRDFGLGTFQDGPTFIIHNSDVVDMTNAVLKIGPGGGVTDTFYIGALPAGGTTLVAPGLSDDHTSGHTFFRVTGFINDTSDVGPDGNDVQFEFTANEGATQVDSGIFTPTATMGLALDGTAFVNFLGGPTNADGPCNNCFDNFVANLFTGTLANTPRLKIAKTHTGNFSPGQQGAAYTLTVSNDLTGVPTSGLVTVSDFAPSSMTVVSMAGTGWTCTTNTCSRSDALAAGASYPAITVIVNVSNNATSPQVNTASVSGGASPSALATDPTSINGAGHLPVVSAGPAQTINLPTSTATLNGFASSDGGPVTVAWSSLNGPGTVTFANPNAAITQATFPIVGTYLLQLRASDGISAALSNTSVTVSAQANLPPIVSAGPDQTISFPANTVTLNGSATDDGVPLRSILTVSWNQVSGPAAVVFTTPTKPVTQATFTAAGTYILRLTASDSQLFSSSDVHVVVQPGNGNQAPAVNAGPNQTTTLPSSAVLNGSVTDDGLPAGGTLTSNWTQIAGPGTVTFSNRASPVTQASFSAPGTYALQLSASDSQLSSVATTTVIVNPDPAVPLVSAGPNQSVALPITQVTLHGSASDPGGAQVTTSWSQVSGPAGLSFANAALPVTNSTFSAPGSYVLRLTASNGQRNASSDVTITVSASALPPQVSAGPNQTITLPNNQATLNGSASDPGGAQLAISWSEVSGPGLVAFSNPGSPATTAIVSLPGVYLLRLTASNQQFTSSSTVAVTVVSGANQPPIVSAGPSQTIQLPANTVTLNGSVTDDGLPTGSVVSQHWNQLSGPALATFGTPAQPVTQATFSVAGTYLLQLLASDTQLTGSSTVTVTVQPSQAQAPQITIAPVSSVTLPNSATLAATVSAPALPPGAVVTVQWSETSGPGLVTFTNPVTPNTLASFSAPGTYVLRFTASDTLQTSFGEIAVQVFPPTTPPPVVSIASPANDAALTSQTSVIGSVSSGNWKVEYSLLDGAGAPTTFVQFASGNGAVANASLGTFDPTILLNGHYAIQLTAADNFGQVSTASITVDVSRGKKVGIFTLSFNDLSVPMPGFPISIIRNYDSRDKRSGDFGTGWNLSLANVRVQKNVAIGKTWDEEFQWTGILTEYCLEPAKSHIVSFTFADGRVYKFQAASNPECQLAGPITAPTFVFNQVSTGSSTSGATLVPIGDTSLIVDGAVPGPQNVTDLNGKVIDYTQFKLTTAEGFTYTIDQNVGVTQVQDLNGNSLTITPNGIFHSSGKSVTFARDAQNRITQITDPNGGTIQYQYNSANDLSAVVDRVNQTTGFAYDSNHFLTNITDPRGIQAIKNVYDASGRLISTTDASGNTVNYTHLLASNQEAIQDRLGNTTTFTYDNDGNVVQTVDALGNVTSATYDADDNQLTATDALGKISKFTYDVGGNRASETDPLGNVAHYTYNLRKQVLTVLDARNKLTQNGYDQNGNLLVSTDPLNNRTIYKYSPAGLLGTVTDAQKNNTFFGYDSAGNLASQTDALGNVSTFTYDANNNKLTQAVTRTKADGSKETLSTQYQYDGSNHLIKTIAPDGTSTQTVYNAIGKQSDTLDALGRKTHYDYDNNGRLIKTTYPDNSTESVTYDANDRRLTSTDRASHVTSFTYDPLGRLTKTTYADNSNTQTSYDAAGRVQSTTDANGNVTKYSYDAAGRRTSVTDALNHVTSFVYDAARNQTRVTDALNHTTQYVYDDAGRRVKTIFPDQTAETVVYDAVGRQISKADQAGKITQFGYDALGRFTTVTDALNQVTSYGYDELGNRITQIDANHNTTSFVYDQLGRRTTRKLPLGMSESYAYDRVGNLTAKTDFNGKTTSYKYDPLNRLLQKIPDASFSAPTVTYSYTPTGRRASMTDASGATSYTYDTRDRLLTKTTPFGTLASTYDTAGNMLSLKSSNTNGASMTYAYDPLNRLSSVTDASGSTNYTYDAAGNLAGYSYPNGIATSYVYDPLNRLINMQSTCSTAAPGCVSPGTTIASYSYTLGAAGNRLSVTELSGRTVQYAYDDLYRLTSETIAGAAAQNGAVSYQYDAVGNRLKLNSTLPAIPTGLLNYDANDRITTQAYDNNGNTINNGIHNVYDFENRLVQRGNVQIVYDGDGNRVEETVAGQTTLYLVAEINPTGYAQVVEERNAVAQAPIKTYIWGMQLVAQVENNSTPNVTVPVVIHYYGYDGHGSVRFLTDTTGAITDTYDYDAFGNLIASTGTTPNNYLFAAEQFDSALGVYYNRARFYDPKNGRFLNADPSEGTPTDPVSLHRYLYANADPIDWHDPSGLTTDYGPYGHAIELFIQLQYAVDYPIVQVSFGAAAGIGKNPALSPDIFDRNRQIWMEIKPMSQNGVDSARVARNAYSANFGPEGYHPDVAWVPQWLNPIPYDGKLFYVVNVQGILFYTADVGNQRTLNQLKTFDDVGNLVRQINAVQSGAIRNLYFILSLTGVGAVSAFSTIQSIINEQNLQNLKQVEEDVDVEELEAIAA